MATVPPILIWVNFFPSLPGFLRSSVRTLIGKVVMSAGRGGDGKAVTHDQFGIQSELGRSIRMGTAFLAYPKPRIFRRSFACSPLYFFQSQTQVLVEQAKDLGDAVPGKHLSSGQRARGAVFHRKYGPTSRQPRSPVRTGQRMQMGAGPGTMRRSFFAHTLISPRLTLSPSCASTALVGLPSTSISIA